MEKEDYKKILMWGIGTFVIATLLTLSIAYAIDFFVGVYMIGTGYMGIVYICIFIVMSIIQTLLFYFALKFNMKKNFSKRLEFLSGIFVIWFLLSILIELVIYKQLRFPKVGITIFFAILIMAKYVKNGIKS